MKDKIKLEKLRLDMQNSDLNFEEDLMTMTIPQEAKLTITGREEFIMDILKKLGK